MSKQMPRIARITRRVIRILGCNPGPMTLQGTNTYVIGTGKKRILLDAGEPETKEYIALLKTVLENCDCTLETIIVSHWHQDHVGGVADVLKEIQPDCTVKKLPRFDPTAQNEEEGYEYVADGDIIKTTGATLRVVATPGHTDDHLCLYFEEEKSLFSGDCILGEGTAVFEDLHSYMNSLQKMMDLKPYFIYPGHGPLILYPLVKIGDYIDHRMDREKQIIDCLQNAKPNSLTVQEIVSIIYRVVPKYLHPAAAINVQQHLNKLLKENVVGEVKPESSNSTEDNETTEKQQDVKYFLF